jgi:hypothetical protein
VKRLPAARCRPPGPQIVVAGPLVHLLGAAEHPGVLPAVARRRIAGCGPNRRRTVARVVQVTLTRAAVPTGMAGQAPGRVGRRALAAR